MNLPTPRRYTCSESWDLLVKAAIQEATRSHYRTGYVYAIAQNLNVVMYDRRYADQYLEVVGLSEKTKPDNHWTLQP